MSILDNYVCGIPGNLVSMMLYLAPAMYYVTKGDYERAIMIWNAASLEVGAINNMIWLLYGVSVLKRDNPVDMVMSSALGCGVNVALLLVLYAYKRQTRRAYGLAGALMIVLLMALIMFKLDVKHTTTIILEYTFGVLGVLALLFGHFKQLLDLRDVTQEVQMKSLWINVLPCCAFAFVQSVATFSTHLEQKFMVISCGVNILFYPIEIIIMAKVHVLLKKGGAKVMRAASSVRGSFSRARNTESNRSQSDQATETSTELSDCIIDMDVLMLQEQGNEEYAEIDADEDGYESALEEQLFQDDLHEDDEINVWQMPKPVACCTLSTDVLEKSKCKSIQIISEDNIVDEDELYIWQMPKPVGVPHDPTSEADPRVDALWLQVGPQSNKMEAYGSCSVTEMEGCTGSCLTALGTAVSQIEKPKCKSTEIISEDIIVEEDEPHIWQMPKPVGMPQDPASQADLCANPLQLQVGMVLTEFGLQINDMEAHGSCSVTEEVEDCTERCLTAPMDFGTAVSQLTAQIFQSRKLRRGNIVVDTPSPMSPDPGPMPMPVCAPHDPASQADPGVNPLQLQVGMVLTEFAPQIIEMEAYGRCSVTDMEDCTESYLTAHMDSGTAVSQICQPRKLRRGDVVQDPPCPMSPDPGPMPENARKSQKRSYHGRLARIRIPSWLSFHCHDA